MEQEEEVEACHVKRDEAQNVSCERIGGEVGAGSHPWLNWKEAQLGLFGSKGVLCMATSPGQQHTTNCYLLKLYFI